LSDFVDALMTRDESLLANARQNLVDAMGIEGMLEASGVAGNFQRMVRIADCIGIPVDDARLEATAPVREALGLNEFHSAQNTFKKQ